jgi:hypothetical protein
MKFPWELNENTMRTKKTQNVQLLCQSPQKKKPWASWVHVASSHWLRKNFIPTFVTIFKLMALTYIWGIKLFIFELIRWGAF